jgi:hypothetical protein
MRNVPASLPRGLRVLSLTLGVCASATCAVAQDAADAFAAGVQELERAAGGRIPDNGQVLCRDCNIKKSDN